MSPLAPLCCPVPGGISRFVLPNKYLLISSVFIFSFAHSHTPFNISELSQFAAQCQAALPVLSVPNNHLLISSVLSFSLYHSHTFVVLLKWPKLPLNAMRFFCANTVFLFSSVVRLQHSPVHFVMFLKCPNLLSCARESFLMFLICPNLLPSARRFLHICLCLIIY